MLLLIIYHMLPELNAKVFVILPLSNISFIESVRLRSIRNARFKFETDIFSSFAISARVDFSESPFGSF